jgi:flagellar hook-associated protein FlgK
VVNVSSAWDLATVQSGTSVPVQWLNHNKTPVDITAQPSAGKLGGLIEVRDTFLTNYRGQLDILAAGLIKAVNSLHSNGIDLTPFTSQTGTNNTPGDVILKGAQGGVDIPNVLQSPQTTLERND